jgi:hypothetical protein
MPPGFWATLTSIWKERITNKMTTPIVIILMIRRSLSRNYLLKKKQIMWKERITNKMTTPIVIILMIRLSLSGNYLLKKQIMDDVDSKKPKVVVSKVQSQPTKVKVQNQRAKVQSQPKRMHDLLLNQHQLH